MRGERPANRSAVIEEAFADDPAGRTIVEELIEGPERRRGRRPGPLGGNPGPTAQGACSVPRDPDASGRCGDVDEIGLIDFADVVWHFNHLSDLRPFFRCLLARSAGGLAPPSSALRAVPFPAFGDASACTASRPGEPGESHRRDRQTAFDGNGIGRAGVADGAALFNNLCLDPPSHRPRRCAMAAASSLAGIAQRRRAGRGGAKTEWTGSAGVHGGARGRA